MHMKVVFLTLDFFYYLTDLDFVCLRERNDVKHAELKKLNNKIKCRKNQDEVKKISNHIYKFSFFFILYSQVLTHSLFSALLK